MIDPDFFNVFTYFFFWATCFFNLQMSCEGITHWHKILAPANLPVMNDLEELKKSAIGAENTDISFCEEFLFQ